MLGFLKREIERSRNERATAALASKPFTTEAQRTQENTSLCVLCASVVKLLGRETAKPSNSVTFTRPGHRLGETRQRLRQLLEMRAGDPIQLPLTVISCCSARYSNISM